MIDPETRGKGSERIGDLERLLGEYLDRLNQGEAIDPEQIESDHPELAADLLERLEAFLQVVPPSTADDNAPLGTLGDYTLRRQIGRGGMGVVYEAWQGSMDRVVALKVLPPGVAADTRAFHRFMREAKTAGQLNHQNVVSVYSTGVEEGTPWYSMEYVEGQTLAQVLGRLKEAEAETETPFGPKDQVDYFAKLARAFADVADGLQHAHSKGVIHRDIKPSNLILDGEGRLRILDFGLARLEGQESLTMSGDFVGTPAYMSPEQARQRKIPVDHRTDIYSLGATLYELITHEQPFRGKDHNDTLSQIIERDPRPPRQLNPRVPQDLETIVLKCLRKDAVDRYGTAEALGQDLRRFVRGDAVEARPAAAWERLARKLWPYRRAFAATGIFLLLTLVGLTAATVAIDNALDLARTEGYATREALYALQVGLAQEAWENGDTARLEELLLAARTASEELADPRGWEWHYLSGLRNRAFFTLPGTKGWGGQVAWSPQRDLLAVTRDISTLEIWDTRSRRLERRLKQELGSIDRIAWSPDGALLAAAGREGNMTVWNTVDGSRRSRFQYPKSDRAPGNGLRALAWSPDGTLLASGGNENVPLVLWNVDGDLLRTLTDESTDACAWRPDGFELVTVTQRSRLQGTLVVWTPNGEELTRWDVGSGAKAVAWSPDGELLAVGGMEGAVVLYDRATGKPGATLHGLAGEIRSVAWDAKRGRIAAGGAGGLVQVWDGVSFAKTATFRGHRDWVKTVSWSADGGLVASAGDDDEVMVWDPKATQNVIPIPGRTPAAWSSGGEFLAVTGDDGEAWILDSDTLDLVLQCGESDVACLSLAWSRDDRYLALGRINGQVEVWDVGRETEVFGARAHSEVRSVAWGTGGILATGGKELPASEVGERVRMYDINSRTEVQALGELSLEPYKSIGTVVWSPDGRLLAAAEQHAVAYVWDTETNEELHRLRLHNHFAWGQRGQYALAWNPEGDRLAAGAGDGSIVVWDTLTGEPTVSTRGHASRVLTVAWSPDGLRLASGGDGVVKIWRVRDEELTQLLTLRHHQAPVFSLAWSPDGRRLLSACRLLAAIWDAPGYELPAQPDG